VYVPFDFEALYKEAEVAVEATKSNKAWEKHGYADFQVWKDDFKRGQTDLYWLCTELLGLALVEKTHRPITDDFFVRKNPYIEANTWKEAVAKQSTIKDRLLLYPRGSFKSTIDRVDAIQWILCFPDIRIVYMTAEDTLATEFVALSREPFEIRENEKLTRFQMLYCSHCIPAKKREDASEFTSRAKKEKPSEASIVALSLGASTAGKHAQVGKFDDCVSNKNSGPMSNSESRKKVTQEVKLARNIIDGFGYKDYVGTYYNEDDAYTSLEAGISKLKKLCCPAWTILPHALKKQIPELLPEDVELLFPEDGAGVPRLTFEAIMTEYNSDPYICSCQLLLNPQAMKTAKFTEPMIRKQIIPFEQFPQAGTYFTATAWDFAKTDGSGSDRSVGMAGFFTTSGPLAGRMYVVDIVRGRFSRSELPYQLANQANRWKPLQHLGIEKSPGADFLTNDILRALAAVGYHDAPSIDWIPVDNQKGAKNARALTLESLFVMNRIFFSDQIPEEVMKEVIREFVNFKGDSNRKNDSVDACAFLARYISNDIEIPQTEKEKISAAWDVLVQKQEHEKMFPFNEDRDSENWKRDGYDTPKPVFVPPPTHWEGIPIYKNPEDQIYGT
jgi:phage terminase large subunit-like protein